MSPSRNAGIELTHHRPRGQCEGTLDSNPVTLHAYWEPMEGPGAERMTASTIYGHHFDNLMVAETKRTYKASDFSVFLPPEPVQVGDT
jgi:hypothetical protein